MVRLFDLRFDQFMGRYGFLAGVVLLLFAGAGFAILGRPGRAPATALALAFAGAAGGLFAIQAAPRFAHAAQRIVLAPPPRAPTGPYAVVEANLVLPSSGSSSSAIRALLFAPAAPGQKAPVSCAGLAGLRPPEAKPDARWPLLLFAPGLEGGAREMASIAAELASRGFFVVALDDPLSQTPSPRPVFFDFSSDDAFAATLEGRVPYARCGTLDVAVATAAAEAADDGAAEPVVLLSPACASMDQFKDYAARGDAFAAMVRGIPNDDVARC